MDWTHADSEIQSTIDRFRADQRWQVQQAEDALNVRDAALATAQRAQTLIDTCEDRIAHDNDEIQQLLRELPRQR